MKTPLLPALASLLAYFAAFLGATAAFAQPAANAQPVPAPPAQNSANPPAQNPAATPAAQPAVPAASAVPQGEVLRFTFNTSRIFPGTTRTVQVYVPAQYNPATPACVYVNQDGLQWQAAAVFDRLIAAKEMPVTIGVFITPGEVPAANPDALVRYNRSYEYDGVGDNYANFLLTEILPAVEKLSTADGRPLKLSKNGNDRAIGGSSSGAIAAFTVAWEHPEEFSRVWSAIGTYVGLRGGDDYPTLIRKFEPKPIRVYLQDGSADQNIYAGDWWMANQMMERALTFAGYEVNHTWGEGAHSGTQGTQIFPDVMRWLWKDWPAPVKAGTSKNIFLVPLLLPGESWKLVADETPAPAATPNSDLLFSIVTGLAVNAQGEVFYSTFNSASKQSVLRKIGLDGNLTSLPAGAIPDVAAVTGRSPATPSSAEANSPFDVVTSQAFSAEGRRYVAVSGNRAQVIAYYNAAGQPTTLPGDFPNADLVVAHNGNVYATTRNAPGDPVKSELYLVKPTGERTLLDRTFPMSGLTLSPDQTLLYVADPRSHWIYSYQIKPDGTLQYKQQYYWLHQPDNSDGAGAGTLCVDRDGRLYAATAAGIQVSDQLGRVNCILPVPGGRVSEVCFGGASFDTLYAIAGGKVYSRKLKITGLPAWSAPLKPTRTGL